MIQTSEFRHETARRLRARKNSEEFDGKPRFVHACSSAQGKTIHVEFPRVP